MNTDNIFVTQEELSKNTDLSGKVSYTNILDTIPNNCEKKPLLDWQKNWKTEWRWRFLKFENDRIIVEISYLLCNKNKRIYFNKKAEWIETYIDPVYDEYVIDEYYYYSDN